MADNGTNLPQPLKGRGEGCRLFLSWLRDQLDSKFIFGFFVGSKYRFFIRTKNLDKKHQFLIWVLEQFFSFLEDI